jgi:hypothetical protein
MPITGFYYRFSTRWNTPAGYFVRAITAMYRGTRDWWSRTRKIKLVHGS